MSGIGALIGLSVGIFLIVKKFNPAYSLMFSAFLAGVIGFQDLTLTLQYMIDGVKDMAPAIVRILSAGVLAGALVKTRSAEKIADFIIQALGQKNVLAALILALFFLTMAGVFIDVAVITAAPIALAAAERVNLSRSAVLLAMIGGGKAGNVVSPNPNTIAAAEKFQAELPSVMLANWLPALAGIFAALLLAWFLSRRTRPDQKDESGLLNRQTESAEGETAEEEKSKDRLPNIFCALLGPAVTLALLALRPLKGISIDPFAALPIGGLVCILATLNLSKLRESLDFGLSKMSGVAILLVGTGTLAGIIKNSTLKEMVLEFLNWTSLPEAALAPISGALMSAATASTTAGATVASISFSEVILSAGITAAAGAAMVNAGATVLDHLPHGSFFHATAGAVQVSIQERLRLIPYETAVGFVIALVSLMSNVYF